MRVGSQLQGKFDTSDVVPQTLMEAWRSAPHFRGTTHEERVAWLRTILAHVLAHHIRQYRGTCKRDLQQLLAVHQESPRTLLVRARNESTSTSTRY